MGGEHKNDRFVGLSSARSRHGKVRIGAENQGKIIVPDTKRSLSLIDER